MYSSILLPVENEDGNGIYYSQRFVSLSFSSLSAHGRSVPRGGVQFFFAEKTLFLTSILTPSFYPACTNSGRRPDHLPSRP